MVWSGLGPLVIDGFADLAPSGRPGLGAYAQAGFGVPVIGVAKSRVPHRHQRGAGRARSLGTPVVSYRGRDASADAAGLVRRMADRYRLPDALHRADTPARAGPPAATITGRQPA